MKKVNFQIFSHLFLFFVFLIGINSDLKGQIYELGGGLGVAAYSGDIIRKIDPGQFGPQVTLFGKRNFDNVWSLRVSFSGATIGGDDLASPIDSAALFRDARFKGNMIEGSAVMEFNFLDYLRNDSEFNFTPYAFFGIGYTVFKGEGNTFSYNATTDYSLGTVVIPFGGGFKYRVTDRLTLAGEVGIRPTYTDYLDKIDSSEPRIPRYADPANPSQPFGINYGNPNDKDWYYFFGLTMSYTFTTTKCYVY